MRNTKHSKASEPPIFRLPPEILLKILSYLLPYTNSKSDPFQNTYLPGSSPNNPIWHRTPSILPLLLTNKHLNDLALYTLYSLPTFVFGVSFKRLTFNFRYAVPGTAIHPTLTLNFPSCLPQEALRRLRKVVLVIERVDDYTGMLKYNCGGLELVTGIKRQVLSMVRLLRPAGRLASLEVRLETAGIYGSSTGVDGKVIGVGQMRRAGLSRREFVRRVGAMQEVLEPLGRMRAERAVVLGEGVEESFARGLEGRIMGDLVGSLESCAIDEEEEDVGSLEDRIRMGRTRAPLIERLPDG